MSDHKQRAEREMTRYGQTTIVDLWRVGPFLFAPKDWASFVYMSLGMALGFGIIKTWSDLPFVVSGLAFSTLLVPAAIRLRKWETRK